MVVGGGSFMNELLTIAGARNVYASLAAPSPSVSMEDVIARDPGYVIRGGEGGDEAPLGAPWDELPAVRAGHVITLPSDVVLRPSVQMGTAARLIARAIHGTD